MLDQQKLAWLKQQVNNDTLCLTIMLQRDHAPQDKEKHQLQFKNLVKEALQEDVWKQERLGAEHVQKQADLILTHPEYWEHPTESTLFYLTAEDHLVLPLGVRVADQWSVDTRPDVLRMIQNEQFLPNYYLMTLNRDSMQLYFVDNNTLLPIDLGEDAPIDVTTALGDQYSETPSQFYSQGAGSTHHGVNTKDDGVEIDWENYYKAVNIHLREHLDNPAEVPLYLYALPENQALFKKITHLPYYHDEISIDKSPAQATEEELKAAMLEINQRLLQKKMTEKENLLAKKYVHQPVDIQQNLEEGKIAYLLIATEVLEEPDYLETQADHIHRQELNRWAIQTIALGGKVFLLPDADFPEKQSVIGILRY